MSVRWMTAVFSAPEPRGTERLMLLALADNADEAGVCWPGVETLRRKCGLQTRRAAERALRRVEAWSATAPPGSVRVRVEHREGRSNLYHLEVVATPDREAGAGAGAGPGRRAGTGGAAGAGSGGRAGRGAVRGPAEPSGNPQDNPQPQEAADAERTGERMLTARGVSVATARSLAAAHPERVGPMCERFDAGRYGPGWLVAAIRDGYAALPSGGLLTYQEMLRSCEREGLTTDGFEAVPVAGEKPRWRRRAAAGEGSGVHPWGVRGAAGGGSGLR